MTTIVEFLTARWSEEEAVARAAIADDGGQDGGFEDHPWLTDGTMLPRFGDAAAELIRTFAVPRRVLADIAAKRMIMEQHAFKQCREAQNPCPTMRALALPFDQHPDYDESWRP